MQCATGRAQPATTQMGGLDVKAPSGISVRDHLVTTTIYLVEPVERIRPGIEGRLERVVEGELLTRHVGGQGIFSTPAMIGLMEITSHGSLDGLIPEGQTTVGYEVHVRHLASTPPGSTVVVTTRLTDVKGNKLYFEVECRRGDTLLGSGIHKRAIVPATF